MAGNYHSHWSRRLNRLRPEPASVPAFLGDDTRAWTQDDPLGVALVISPSRGGPPMQHDLSSSPMIGARPSELARASSAVSTRLIPAHLDTDAAVVENTGTGTEGYPG